MLLKKRTVIGIMCLVLLSGCATKSYQTVGGKQTSQKAAGISQEELRAALNDFEDYAIRAIDQSANQLDELTSVGSQKIRLLARIRLKQAMHTMLQQEDPLVAFIETWALSNRMARYFEEGQGSVLYGSNQHIIIATVKNIENEIEAVGRRFMEDDTFHETLSLIENFAGQNPINGSFTNLLVYAVETVPGEPSPFSRVVAIPMSPFKAVEGVDRTASSIYGVRNSVDRFTDIVADFPEAARWQMLLLLMDVENVGAVREFLDSMESLSQSSEKMTTVLQEYPEKIQQQTSVLIGEIDAKQANVQTTLQQAQDTAVSVEKTAAQVKETIGAAHAAVWDLNQTMLAWTDAANATTDTLSIIKGWTDAPREGPSTFKITDYRDVASETARAAGELQALLAQTDGKLTSVIDRITWRCVQVVLLIFVLAVIYRLVFARGAAGKGK